MKIEIKLIAGKWFVNDKPYKSLYGAEKIFFEEFLTEMRIDYGK